MTDRSIALDEATFESLAALSEREGIPVAELIREWTESAVLAAQLVKGLQARNIARASLKARERVARANVSGFSVRDNVSREQLYRG